MSGAWIPDAQSTEHTWPLKFKADDVNVIDYLETLLDDFTLGRYRTVDNLWQKFKECAAYCENFIHTKIKLMYKT